jgi:hypothetical protein
MLEMLLLMYSNTPPTPSQEGKRNILPKNKNSVELCGLCGEKNQTLHAALLSQRIINSKIYVRITISM